MRLLVMATVSCLLSSRSGLAQQDTTPPVLTAIGINPAIFSTEQADVTIGFCAGATDNSSGVARISLFRTVNPADRSSLTTLATLNFPAGTLSANACTTATLPRFTPHGTYYFAVEADDAAGNTVRYANSALGTSDGNLCSRTVCQLVDAAPHTGAFTVNSQADVPDANPGDGACETAFGNGVCTLRAAVMETDALPGADTIVLPAGFYRLTIPPSGDHPIDPATGDLDVTDSLTLLGAGAATTIIDGGLLDGLISLQLPELTTVLIRDITLQRGRFGIADQSLRHSVTVDSCIIKDNIGPGISPTCLDFEIRNSVITGNGDSGVSGGTGLFITDTIISDNVTPNDGAGIHYHSDLGGMQIVRTIVRDNHAVGDGGGIFSDRRHSR